MKSALVPLLLLCAAFPAFAVGINVDRTYTAVEGHAHDSWDAVCSSARNALSTEANPGLSQDFMYWNEREEKQLHLLEGIQRCLKLIKIEIGKENGLDLDHLDPVTDFSNFRVSPAISSTVMDLFRHLAQYEFRFLNNSQYLNEVERELTWLRLVVSEDKEELRLRAIVSSGDIGLLEEYIPLRPFRFEREIQFNTMLRAISYAEDRETRRALLDLLFEYERLRISCWAPFYELVKNVPGLDLAEAFQRHPDVLDEVRRSRAAKRILPKCIKDNIVDVNVLRLLESLGAELSPADSSESYAHIAMKENKPEFALALSKLGVSLEAQDFLGKTVLDLATERGLDVDGYLRSGAARMKRARASSIRGEGPGN